MYYLTKYELRLKNQNLDSVFNHRMCRLYVKCDEVDQQITERNWYVSFSNFNSNICVHMLELLYFQNCRSCPSVTSSSTVFSKQLDIPQVSVVSVASKFLLTIDNGLYLLCVNQSFIQKKEQRKYTRRSFSMAASMK